MSREKFLERCGAKQTHDPRVHGVAHKRSKVQEKEVAKRLNGETTPGSGSKSVKGDVRKRNVIRVECKTTTAKSFRVTREMIRKIEEAALPHNEVPAMVIEFIDADGKPLQEVALLPTYVLEECYG